MSVIKRNDSTERILFERKRIDITGPYDRLTVLIFVISFAVSAIAGAIFLEFTDLVLMDLSLFATLPLVVLGAFHLLRSKVYRYLLIVLAVAAGVMFFMGVSYVTIMAIAMISVGISGVVQLVAVLQRFLFYRVVASIEYLNVREKLTLWDKAVAFLFNISNDLDTRNLEIDANAKRASLPWKDIGSSLKISFIIGLFIWIYISMNPSWMEYDLTNVPVYLFALIMYIPVIVLPFSIFMSLNVRIETRYRDFKIYDGIKGTLMRMAIPVFATFMYIILAVNRNGFVSVLTFIGMSVVFNFLICVFACLIYYKGFESDIVDAIILKWKQFRPVQMMMSVKDPDSVLKDDVPDTPRRDYSDFGELVFPE